MDVECLMHSLYEHWLWLWVWLTNQGAARATVILVFITAWYAYLTFRMAKAMNRQTRALMQPVISVDFNIDKKEFYPKGGFRVTNQGAQPVLLLDMRLECRLNGLMLFDEYLFYERHILPPNDDIGFKFDFLNRYEKKGMKVFSPGMASFNLQVVASDIGEEVILAYRKFSYWDVLTVKKGLPLRVRWKNIASFFKQRYFRILYRFRPPKLNLTRSKTQEHNAQTKESQIEISIPPDSNSPNGQ